MQFERQIAHLGSEKTWESKQNIRGSGIFAYIDPSDHPLISRWLVSGVLLSAAETLILHPGAPGSFW